MECLQQIPQPQFQKDNLYGYVCNKCNFVRFNKYDIERHISCQHGNTSEKVLFVKVVFLNLEKMTQKKKYESDEFESEYEWEFDADYTKNLQLEYEEEKRLELEEGYDLEEHLESEALGKSSIF